MRYIILNKSITNKEISSRIEYIEKATGLYFLTKKIDEGIEFISIPSNSIDCVLIVGHNVNIIEYLDYNKVLERNIAVVSCIFNIAKGFLKEKKVYVSYGDCGKTSYYDGTPWNLYFNVSKEELKIINSYGDFMDRINKYFRRIV